MHGVTCSLHFDTMCILRAGKVSSLCPISIRMYTKTLLL